MTVLARCRRSAAAPLKVALNAAALLAVLCGLAPRPAAAAVDVDPAVRAAETRRVAVVERASRPTVAVFAPNGQGGGSGVVIAPDGYALSNFHVTQACGAAMKCGLVDGRLYDAVIVGVDPTGDVALIKLLGRDDFPFAELADSDAVRTGDGCFTIGNPFLLATDFKPSVAYGVISGVHRYQYPAGTLLEYADCLQADAAINPGNSGGPLFDDQGRLIGINGRGSFEKRGRVNVGVGYAISINQIKNFLGHLKSGRVVDHATLGARVASDSRRRVVVDDILTSSDAFRRGLRYGDEVLSFAGRPTSTVNGFKNALGIYPKGWRVPLVYRRDERIVDILVRLSGVHAEAELAQLLEAQVQPDKAPHGPRGRKPPGPKEPRSPRPDGQRPPDGKSPDDKLPDGKSPDDESPGAPHDPEQPQHASGRGAPPPMPAIVKEHFIARPGYVNYYFNQLNCDRVWRALASRGDLSPLAGKWTISGTLASGGEFEIELSDKQALLRLPGGEAKCNLGGNLGDSLGPPNSGGLLVTLAMWRRLLAVGPKQFGDLYYLGTCPVADHAGLADVLVGTSGGVETRFLVDPGDGALREVEMWPDDDADPCEMYFADYHELDGRMLPGRLEVHFGDGIYQVFTCKRFQFEPAGEP
ncbi:MAG TPA: trypsin-like peptidase domain-containing protein [Pirellulales bacterium]|jgi:S1-C subfamily serine protease|nr:trypsin-like peptidase domain-containing protein [Pirellulales bacterium]